MGRWHTDKDYDRLLVAMEELGWRIEKGRHLKCYCPFADKCLVPVANTASDWRALKNTEAQFKRCEGYVR